MDAKETTNSLAMHLVRLADRQPHFNERWSIQDVKRMLDKLSIYERHPMRQSIESERVLFFKQTASAKDFRLIQYLPAIPFGMFPDSSRWWVVNSNLLINGIWNNTPILSDALTTHPSTLVPGLHPVLLREGMVGYGSNTVRIHVCYDASETGFDTLRLPRLRLVQEESLVELPNMSSRMPERILHSTPLPFVLADIVYGYAQHTGPRYEVEILPTRTTTPPPSRPSSPPCLHPGSFLDPPPPPSSSSSKRHKK